MSLVCVSLAARNPAELEVAARAGMRAGADILELRLDCLKDCGTRQLAGLRRRIGFLPLIATIRPTREGGAYRGSENLRLELLEQAIGCGFDYVDLELGMERARLDRLLALCRRRGVKSIVSYHDHARTPALKRIVRRIEQCASFGDIGKVAFAARSFQDSTRIIKAARAVGNKPLRFIAIGMGEHGTITRTLGPFLGSELVYAGLEGRRRTADGQQDVGELRRLWGAAGPGKRVTRSTKLFGLMGFPLGHSLSPLMHNTAFRALGIDAFYLPFEVEPEQLEGTLLALRAAGLRGANVTIPHKERMMRLLDGVDETAQKVGAVNTILNRNGNLTGYNTDVTGFTGALAAAGVRLEDASALVLGAGGAARAAVHGLLENGARVTVANRSRRRALGLREHLGARDIDVVDLRDVERLMGDADLLVNCTPVGMRSFARGSPVPIGLIRSDMAVFDMVYNPVRTALLAGAERRGATTISGMEMFILQGMESFRLWTGRTFPVKTIRRVLAHSQNQ
jgi:3-dehydroquinate dehydratase/shikimate dehydrogenase